MNQRRTGAAAPIDKAQVMRAILMFQSGMMNTIEGFVTRVTTSVNTLEHKVHRVYPAATNAAMYQGNNDASVQLV